MRQSHIDQSDAAAGAPLNGRDAVSCPSSQFPTQPASPTSVNASVIDIFCGAGGLSHGFKAENFSIACGIDLDESCRYAYEANNGAPFIRQDVAQLTGKFLNENFEPGKFRILIGCAPCQPFSPYNKKNNNPQWRLLTEFGRLITEAKPHVVSMENVPRLTRFRGGETFRDFVNGLTEAGYTVWWKSVFCPDYGVPQNRTRLVLLASQFGHISLEPPTHKPESYVSVREAIGHLPQIKAGETDLRDPLHRSSSLSETNLKRIKAAIPGGTWRDWGKDLVAECHKKETGQSYHAVYGRMVWDAPSPTITTQFIGFGNGRFGHPEQDRAISLREGAILQTFPSNYVFVPVEEATQFKKIGRMIGNAVPVLLAQAIARSIRKHLKGIKDV